MTNTPEAIRKALEPMGYAIHDGWFTIDGVELAGVSTGYFDEEECANDALTHFLNDKAQTGARLLEVANDYRFFGVYLSALAPHDDVDAEIARMWLKVHGLEDPRSEE